VETAELNDQIGVSGVTTVRKRMPHAWLILMLVALAAGVGVHRLRSYLSGYIYHVRVGGIVLDGVTLPVAQDRLRAVAAQLDSLQMTLRFTDDTGREVHSLTTTPQQMGITPDAERTSKNALHAASRWNSVPALVLRNVSREPPVEVRFVFAVDKARSERFWRQVRQRVERPPQDARLIISPDGVRQVVPERSGLKLPAEPVQSVLEVLQDMRSSVTIPLQTALPRITTDHLHTIDTQLSTAVTRFSEAQRNRSHNIRQATARINGVVLLPGEVFSYNQTVGPRTLREGFRKAPVIVHGELVPGDGGGVCQVSSTLYMAALQAGLEIAQRSKHAFPIGYAPAGLDATVVYGALDLRFRNSTSYPIAIMAYAHRGKMVVQVWGNLQAKRRVRIQRVVHSVIETPVKTVPAPHLPEGVQRVVTKGHAGMKVSVYRIMEEPGKPPVREKISTDSYRPQTRVVMVGQAPRPAGEPTVQPNQSPPQEEEPLLQP